MAVPFATENFFLYQGEDFRKSFPFPDANDDFEVYAEIRRWGGGPEVMPFAASCDAATQTLTIAMPSADTAKIDRTNLVYDILVNDGAGVHPFRSGVIGLMVRVSQNLSSPAYRTWGILEFTPGLTWDQIEDTYETWDDLLK